MGRTAAWPVPLVLLVLLAVLAGCSTPGSPPAAGPTQTAPPTRTSEPSPVAPDDSPSAAPSSPPVDRCHERVTALSLREQVGQLFMVGVSTAGPSDADEAVLRSSAAGSVVLLGNTSAGAKAVARVVKRVRKAADSPAGVGLLVAADQEGGQVQRLQGRGFRQIPAAYEQGGLSDAELTRRVAAWGRDLQDVAVDADLAPVADVVPEALRDRNAPIGRLDRGYGADPDLVARKTAAFVRGMDAAGVATAVKHFPGLGRVRGNTDFEAGVVDRVTRADDPFWTGFRSAIDAGADMVMIASATYAKIDPDHRAAFSATIMELLRRELGFAGVIISDDLAARAFDDVRPGARAIRFLRAGGDLAIVGDPSLVESMAGAVADEAEEDADFAAQIEAKATRVIKMKAKRNLVDC